MNAGHAQREKPRTNILRGNDPNSSLKLSRIAPPKADEGIKDGMVVSLAVNSGVYEFVKGGAAGRVIYISYRDQSDSDVLASRNLVALSCADDYEVETAFFKAGDVYNIDTPLSYDGVTGNIKVAGAGETIIGYVSGTENSPLDHTATNSGAKAPVQVVRWTTKLKLPALEA